MRDGIGRALLFRALVPASRRSRLHMQRALALGLLLGVISMSVGGEVSGLGPMDMNEARARGTAFARSAFQSLAVFLFLMAAAVGPITGAGTVIEDRRSGLHELVTLAGASPRGLLQWTMVLPLLRMLTLIAAFLPVPMLLLPLGGVTGAQVVAVFVIVACTGAWCTWEGARSAVAAPTVGAAVIGAWRHMLGLARWLVPALIVACLAGMVGADEWVAVAWHACLPVGLGITLVMGETGTVTGWDIPVPLAGAVVAAATTAVAWRAHVERASEDMDRVLRGVDPGVLAERPGFLENLLAAPRTVIRLSSGRGLTTGRSRRVGREPVAWLLQNRPSWEQQDAYLLLGLLHGCVGLILVFVSPDALALYVGATLPVACAVAAGRASTALESTAGGAPPALLLVLPTSGRDLFAAAARAHWHNTRPFMIALVAPAMVWLWLAGTIAGVTSSDIAFDRIAGVLLVYAVALPAAAAVASGLSLCFILGRGRTFGTQVVSVCLLPGLFLLTPVVVRAMPEAAAGAVEAVLSTANPMFAVRTMASGAAEGPAMGWAIACPLLWLAAAPVVRCVGARCFDRWTGRTP